MTGLRERLPQGSGDQLFVTDGGLETELVFHDGIDLPSFAAFPLLRNPDTRARLRRYFDGYLDIARKHRRGLHRRDADVARESGLGFGARVLARAARRRQPLGGGARRGGQDGCGG